MPKGAAEELLSSSSAGLQPKPQDQDRQPWLELCKSVVLVNGFVMSNGCCSLICICNMPCSLMNCKRQTLGSLLATA